METIDAALDVSDKLKGKMPEDLGLVEGFSCDKEIPLLTKRDEGFRWTTMTLPLLEEDAFPVADQLNDIAIARILQKIVPDAFCFLQLPHFYPHRYQKLRRKT